MAEVIFVDTSAFYALQDKADVLEHPAAVDIAKQLEAGKVSWLTTDYVLDESYTLIRGAFGHGLAVAFGRDVQKGTVEIVQVDPAVQRKAWEIFERYSDKEFSFTDCTSFAVMREGRIPAAFTFDRDFQQFGFRTYPARLPVRRM